MLPLKPSVQETPHGDGVHAEEPRCLKPESLVVLIPQLHLPARSETSVPLQLGGMREWQVQTEEYPGQDEIPWLNERRCDERESGRHEPDEEEGGVGGLRRVWERKQATRGASGRGFGIHFARWRGISGTGRLCPRLRRRAKCLNRKPGTSDVSWRCSIANPPVCPHYAEYIEDIVAVVCKREWVDDGVEADGNECEEDEEAQNQDAWKQVPSPEEEKVLQVRYNGKPSNECQGDTDEVLIGEGPAEEDQERPEIQDLWSVDGGNVI